MLSSKSARRWITAISWLGAWSFLTLTIDRSINGHFNIWYLSAGLLLLGIGGIKPLGYLLILGIGTAHPSSWFSSDEESIIEGDHEIPFTIIQ